MDDGWIGRARRRLVALGVAGGWGYRRGATASVEATALAALGLLATSPSSDADTWSLAARAGERLVGLQRQRRPARPGRDPACTRMGNAVRHPPLAGHRWIRGPAPPRHAVAPPRARGHDAPRGRAAGHRRPRRLDPRLAVGRGRPRLGRAHGHGPSRARPRGGRGPSPRGRWTPVPQRPGDRLGRLELRQYGRLRPHAPPPARSDRPRPARPGRLRRSRGDVGPSLAYLRDALPGIRAASSLGWGILGLRAWGETTAGSNDWVAESAAACLTRDEAAPRLGLLLLASAESGLGLLLPRIPR